MEKGKLKEHKSLLCMIVKPYLATHVVEYESQVDSRHPIVSNDLRELALNAES
jgi:hypothetical protein